MTIVWQTGRGRRVASTTIYFVGLFVGAEAFSQVGPTPPCSSTQAADCADTNYVDSSCGLTEFQTNWDDPSWICSSVCQPATPQDCADADYRRTICGRLEWASNFGDPGWICAPVLQQELANHPLSPSVLPEETISASGVANHGIAARQDVARAAPIGASMHTEAYDPMFSPGGTAVLTERVRYVANGERLASCREVAFESLWDYAVWHEQYQVEESLPDVAIDAAFSDLLVDSAGQVTTDMYDRANRPIGSPVFFTRNPTMLHLWDRQRSQANTHHTHRFRPDLTWHSQMRAQATAQSWSTEYLEELQVQQERFAVLVGQWMMHMRWLVSEWVKEEAVFNDVRAESARLRVAQRFGMDDYAVLTWTTEALAGATGPRGLRRAKDHFWLVPEGLVAGGGQNFWSPDDPIPLEDYHAYVPPPGRIDGEDPDLPLLNAAPDVLDRDGDSFKMTTAPILDRLWNQTASDARYGSRFEAVRSAVLGNAQALSQDIDALYDALYPICSQTPSPCEWSPSVFLDAFVDHYEARREGIDARCLRQTGNVFDQQRIYEASFSKPVVPDDFHLGGSSQFNLDYASRLATFETLEPNRASYRALADAYLDFLTETMVKDIRNGMHIDPATGQPSLATTTSEEKTIGGSMFGVSTRSVSRSGGRTARELNSHAGGFCEPALEFQTDWDVAINIFGTRVNVIASRYGEETVRVSGDYSEYVTADTEFFGMAQPYVDYESAHGLGVLRVGVVPPELKLRILQVPPPGASPIILFSVFGVPVTLQAGATLDFGARLDGTIVLGSNHDACARGLDRSHSLEASGSIDLEAYVDVALDAGIVRVGVRGRLTLLGVTLIVGVHNTFETGDLAQTSSEYRQVYDCTADAAGTWTCNTSPGDQLLVGETRGFVDVVTRIFDGRITLFVEVAIPLVPKLELDIVRFRGARNLEQMSKVSSLRQLNPDVWCNPLIFGDPSGKCP